MTPIEEATEKLALACRRARADVEIEIRYGSEDSTMWDARFSKGHRIYVGKIRRDCLEDWNPSEEELPAYLRRLLRYDVPDGLNEP